MSWIVDDLRKRKFGKLTALDFVGQDKFGNALWDCVCECGRHKVVRASSLKSGSTKSCGCVNRAGDLIGKTFGNLTVLERAGINEHNFVLWKCKCNCGKIIVVQGRYLKTGQKKSCGCLKKQIKK